MAAFIYAGEIVFTASDRAMLHLEVVVRRKLSDQQGFSISWFLPASAGHGRASAWLCPGIQVGFSYSGAEVGELNPNWLLMLFAAADSVAGLRLLSEPPLPGAHQSELPHLKRTTRNRAQ